MVAFEPDFGGLAGFCARAGLVHKLNPSAGAVAVFHRLLDRDAPILLGSAGFQVRFELRLPFSVPEARRPAVAERLGALPRGPRGSWTLRGGTILYRTTLFALTDATDEAASAALDEVRAHAAAAAKDLQALSQG